MFLNPPFDSVPHLIRPVRNARTPSGEWLVGRVQQTSFRKTSAHKTICDGDVLGGPRITKREGTLGANRVIPRRIHAAIGNAHISATIEIDSVAIGIDFQIVHGEIVYAGRQNSEMPAV